LAELQHKKFSVSSFCDDRLARTSALAGRQIRMLSDSFSVTTVVYVAGCLTVVPVVAAAFVSGQQPPFLSLLVTELARNIYRGWFLSCLQPKPQQCSKKFTCFLFCA